MMHLKKDTFLIMIGLLGQIISAPLSPLRTEENPVTLPFAKGEHPRIIITKDEIPVLAAKVDEPTDPLYPRYMAMKRDVDAAVSNNWNWEYIKGPSSGEAQVRAVSAAFVYLIENYLHPDSSSFYVNGVKQVLENTNPNSYTGYSNYLQSFAVAYDWIYNGLSSEDRITIGNKLMTSYAVWQDPNNRPRGEWPLDSWHTMMSNLPSGEWTYAAIAIWNETDLNGNADNSLAQTRLNQIRTFLLTRKIPFTNMVGGGINPDGGYDDIGGTRQFALELYAWDKATGENLWSTSRYLSDNIITRLFAWKIYTNRFVPFGIPDYASFSSDYPIEILSKKDTTGQAQHIANDIFNKGYTPNWKTDGEQYRWIIFYDPTKPATNYNTLPLAHYAQGYNADGSSPIEGLDAGWVFFRSGWTRDDTLIAFTSGDWFTPKQVYNVNTFSIYRGGDLTTINSNNQLSGKVGGVNLDFQLNYGKPTIATNSITVSDTAIAMDQGQEMFQYDTRSIDDSFPYYYYDSSNKRDNYNAYKAYPNETVNTEFKDHYKGAKYIDRGNITKFETKTNYDYAVGDGSMAYHPDRLTSFQRALAFLDKKYLVILDRVSAAKPEFVKRWYLHTVKEPTILGAPLIDTSSRDGSTIWSQADFNNLYIDSDRHGVSVGSGPSGGRLFIKSLLPEGAAYRKRGGEGFFFWRNDRSWNPEPGSLADISYYYYQGNAYPNSFEGRKGWRLEQDVSGKTDDIFLNVLFPTDAIVTSMPETDLVSCVNMVGAHIKDPAKNYIALFSSDPQGTAQNNVTYSLNDESSAMGQHLLFDIAHGTYDVYKNDARIFSDLVPSSQGVLSFESRGGLSFRVIPTETQAPEDDTTINHPPALEAIGNKSFHEGESISFTIKANDSDGNPLTYSISNLPPETSFDNITGKFDWFNARPAGEYPLTFSVVDTGGLSDSESITIEVKAHNLTVKAGPDQAVDEGSLVILSAAAMDSQGHPLNFSWSQIAGPAVDIRCPNCQTTQFRAPQLNQDTTLSFRLSATCGALTAFDEVNVYVKNILPVCSKGSLRACIKSISPNPAKELEIVTFRGSGENDRDRKIVRYQWRLKSTTGKESLLSSQPAFSTNAIRKGRQIIYFRVGIKHRWWNTIRWSGWAAKELIIEY